MGLINIGEGLSKMGDAFADVGSVGLKNQLDNQKLELANQLATQRETTVAGVTGAESRKTAGFINTLPESPTAAAERGSREKIAGEQITSSEKIAGEQIAATKENLKTQLQAEGQEIQYTADGPILFNRLTGKSSPITDANGKPMDLVNTALVPIAMATVNSANEQLRSENQTFNTRMNSLNDQMKEAANAPTAVTPEAKMKAQAPYKAEIDRLTRQHQTVVDSLHETMSKATASLYAKGATEQDAKGVTGKPTQDPGNLDSILFPQK